MNLLLDKLPETITIDGREHKIKTNFRDWIKFEIEMIKDSDGQDKIMLMNDLLYNDMPQNLKLTAEKLIEFYTCGEVANKNNGKGNHKRIYDYQKDQFMIYIAFMQYYQIDLNKIEYMHWWKFRKMFIELPDESKIKKVMMYRSINITSNMSPEQRKFYAEMKRIYALKEDTEKKAHGFGAILANGMNIKEP